MGTILDDDGTLGWNKASVSWKGGVAPNDVIKGYVEQDVQAAVERIDKALGGAPHLEIVIQATDLSGTIAAAGDAIVTPREFSGLKDDMWKSKDLSLVLPLAAYEKLKGIDLNGGGPDLKIWLDFDKLEMFYSWGGGINRHDKCDSTRGYARPRFRHCLLWRATNIDALGPLRL